MNKHTSKRHAYLAIVDSLEGRQAVSSLMIGTLGAGGIETPRTVTVTGRVTARSSEIVSQATAGDSPPLFAITRRTTQTTFEMSPSPRIETRTPISNTRDIQSLTPFLVQAASIPTGSSSGMSNALGTAREEATTWASQRLNNAGQAAGSIRGLASTSSSPTSGNNGQQSSTASGAIRPLTMAPSASQPGPVNTPVPIFPGTGASSASANAGLASHGMPKFSPDGSGGGNFGPPSITYSGGYSTQDSGGTYYDIIGDEATIRAGAPDSTTLDSVTWSFSGSAMVQYSSEGAPSSADGQFDYNQIFPMNMSNPQTFYWGASGGVETITANVSFSSDGSSYSESTSISVNVAYPAATFQFTPFSGGGGPSGGTGPVIVGNDMLSYGNSSQPGMSWTVDSVGSNLNDSASTSVPYSVGMVQVLMPSNGYSYPDSDYLRYDNFGDKQSIFTTRNSSDQWVSPGVLLDTSPAGSSTPWYGATGSAPISGTDTPAFSLNSSWPTETMNVEYGDQLMYKPNGGIWVPLGSFSWGASATANYGSEWGTSVSTSSQGVWHNYTPAWPEWSGLTSTYLSDGWHTIS